MHVSWILEMLGEKCLFQVTCPINSEILPIPFGREDTLAHTESRYLA